MVLKKKRILITGGTSGIGLELVKQLCPRNEVIVISRSPKLSQEVSSPEVPVKVFQADLANRLQLESVANEINLVYDSVDVLINNAAIQNTAEFLSNDFNYDGIQREIDINFTSVCQLTYLVLPLLQKAGKSVVLNINSGLALSPKRTSAVYCGTKSALNAFSQSLQYQLSETNIAVQQAFLPLVDTAMTRGRGNGKLTPADAASRIIKGIEDDEVENDIGKTGLLRLLVRFAPGVARRIMMNS